MAVDMKPRLFEALINHLVLPPRLPGKEDGNPQLDRAIFDRLIDASKSLSTLTNNECWESVRRSLQVSKSIQCNPQAKLDKALLISEMRVLDHNVVMVLNVVEQNAGLLISRHKTGQEERVVFEVFEASASAADVLAAENALQRDFPGYAASISYSTFTKAGFIEELATFLEQASIEPIKRFSARSHKAGTTTVESRDTADPALISQMLTALLESTQHGRREYPPILRKRVHDDVCWFDAEKPWRRSPLWLMLRVSMQRRLCHLEGGHNGRVLYKFLVSLVLANLLGESLQVVGIEQLSYLKTKLCRRLAKLEAEQQTASVNDSPVYEQLFKATRPIFHNAVTMVSRHIEGSWNIFKSNNRRPVLPLPQRAPEADLRLRLPNSGIYLDSVLAEFRRPVMQPSSHNFSSIQFSAIGKEQVNAFVAWYSDLCEVESGIENIETSLRPAFSDEDYCSVIAVHITNYITKSNGAYVSNPEETSTMLLAVMELWVSLDKTALIVCPLLKHYHPYFVPEMLNVLHCPLYKDMCRLQKIQEYLHSRQGGSLTIFENPIRGCFADRYFDESAMLQEFMELIKADAAVARDKKKEEFKRMSDEYDALMREVSESTCLYTDDEYLGRVHDDKACSKCYLTRKARRLRLTIFEYPLPSKTDEAKAVVFELSCPKWFASYRDATWKIVQSLASPQQALASEPRVLLNNYDGLKKYVKWHISSISLASPIKSFRITHFESVRFPTSVEDVLKPNGLKFFYWDTPSKSWPGSQNRRYITFAHHFQFILPTGSPFAQLMFSAEYAVGAEGPSSYQVISNQTKTPSGLNVLEYAAYTSLLGGKTRRLTALLVELGSQNLNFGTEAVATLVKRLLLEAGPVSPCNDPLRLVYQPFRDKQFCTRLIMLLNQRLTGMSTNGRDNFAMETILTFLLRLMELAPPDLRTETFALLTKARAIIELWLDNLRIEMQGVTDPEVAKRCSRYTLSAALLCRRTFTHHLSSSKLLDGDEIRSFIQASITLEAISSDPTKLPLQLKHSMIRDLKFVHRMRFLLKDSFNAFPGALMLAVNHIWPQPERTTTVVLAPHFLGGPDPLWIETIIDTEGVGRMLIHLHLLRGHLLVNCQPLGQLPKDYKDSTVLKELFGQTTLMVYPSSMPGFAYTLYLTPNDHQIHVGFRNQRVVVRACFHNNILELIPREVFESAGSFDLPNSLLRDCVHWLDLRTGLLEIRPKPHIFHSKPANWTLNVRQRVAHRRTGRLICPYSSTARKISRIFDHFENHTELTIFQPQTRALSVELKRLSLRFFVNQRRFMQSPELQAEISDDQTCGIWEGLRSKLLLQDITNSRSRSILVPMISDAHCLKYKLHGIHMATYIRNSGAYGRYFINPVLGRLDCPAEPWLLYQKALLFALTSFILPDDLTGRTGTEEALSLLKSPQYEPWSTLNTAPYNCLLQIANISPKREYYPRDGSTLQRTWYDNELAIYIQFDGYRSIVQGILEHHDKIGQFTPMKFEMPRLEVPGSREQHLVRRNLARWHLFMRQVEKCAAVVDKVYHSRDGYQPNQSRSNVFESLDLLVRWPQTLKTTKDLSGILQMMPNITGFLGTYQRLLLSERLKFEPSTDFGPLWNTCRSFEGNREQLFWLFAELSFDHCVDMQLIRTLIACTILQELKALSPPSWHVYVQYRQNNVPSASYLCRRAKHIPVYAQFKTTKKARVVAARTDLDCQAIAQHLLKQWPCAKLTIDNLPTTGQIDIATGIQIIIPEWERMFMNFELWKFIEQIQTVLNRSSSQTDWTMPVMMSKEPDMYPTRDIGDVVPVLENLLSRAGPAPSTIIIPVPTGLRPIPSAPATLKSIVQGPSPEVKELGELIAQFPTSNSFVRQTYAKNLLLSLDAFQSFDSVPKFQRKTVDRFQLGRDIQAAKQAMAKSKNDLLNALSLGDATSGWLTQAGLWPCTSTIALLEKLRSTSKVVFGSRMKQSLTDLGVKLTMLQRLLRLEAAFKKGSAKSIADEQNNMGHETWDPFEDTEWLLLEIDSNILIRPGQIEVARATIAPASRTSSLLQLNMGQGKTSVIIPMVALKLADSRKLVRVIVPKPLLLQTAQLLQTRLGGLLGRKLLHLPFSRKTQTTHASIKTYMDMHENMLRACGITLALPEHLLSFQLSGLQALSDNRVREGVPMVNVQKWMRSKSRDVIDESDQILSLRTQLIYPSGPQKTVDGAPYRWETVQVLLRLVQNHLFELQDKFPQSIEIVPRPNHGFPFFYFLRQDVEDALLKSIIAQICNGHTSILNTSIMTKEDRRAVRDFLSETKVKKDLAKRIRDIFPDQPALKKNLFLLRGLLVHRILLLCLKKRWQVQYGIHPLRFPLAVPYHSKGCPSDQAEFGYPDVAITLTCLAFYYEGLTTKQFHDCLEHLLKSDDPASEYDRWTDAVDLPDSLREWNSINLEDEGQMTSLWSYLRLTVSIIDYFLNHISFPVHAKQLALKLQASGWDLPLLPDENSTSLTTGFSGTNDTRSLLPETITQNDLPNLLHTNAEVLTYLLQPRNRKYVLAADNRGRHISEHALLKKISAMKIRILIDAGAAILEMSNAALAKVWLEIDEDADASMYMDDTGKPLIYQRGCKPVPLLASPYADNLYNVLVFIDQAHCRGLDLQLHPQARGALTLGPGLNKDALVQAAMRLRQLATSQSILFIGTPSTHQSILDVTGKTHGDLIESCDVIRWLLEQTTNTIEQLQPLYFSQGIDFCQRMQAAVDHNNFLTDANSRENYIQAIRHIEQQSLEELYGPKTKTNPVIGSGTLTPRIAGYVKQLNQRKKAFRDTGNAVHSSALQEVEQEREVHHEVEQEREVQPKTHYEALIWPGLHRDIYTFATTGRLPADSMSFEHAFLALRRTGVGMKFGINDKYMSSRFYVSREFTRTRPVNWILWSMVTESALVVTPEEAESLIPIVRTSKKPVCHLLTYAAPVTRKMLHFANLQFYALPALPALPQWTPPLWFTVELGLFAGRLYFDFNEYEYLCKFLGFEPGAVIDELLLEEEESYDFVEDATGDVNNETEEPRKSSNRTGLTSKPLSFLHEWLTVRRKGQDFAYTPMGFVCQGKPLTASHSFFSQPDAVRKPKPKVGGNGTSAPEPHSYAPNNEDDDLDDNDGAWVEEMGNLIDENADESESDYVSPSEYESDDSSDSSEFLD
ncbi:p-loop containing nucleoside triphosphate hydrolase protein [Rutstroemia sp. NJR-2017a BBW]|nr:p-loop containing nucleoside triphosphate hydrolase protein [Rutstroemia sp. NJR-2017a BBW]